MISRATRKRLPSAHSPTTKAITSAGLSGEIMQDLTKSRARPIVDFPRYFIEYDDPLGVANPSRLGFVPFEIIWLFPEWDYCFLHPPLIGTFDNHRR